jgi:hypothetical protein
MAIIDCAPPAEASRAPEPAIVATAAVAGMLVHN